MRRVAKIREQARGKRKGYRSKGSRDEKCPEKCPREVQRAGERRTERAGKLLRRLQCFYSKGFAGNSARSFV